MKHNMKALALAVAVSAAVPVASASAATLDGVSAPPVVPSITFTSHGKAADLAIPWAANPTITEMGSRLHVSGSCTAIDDHNATCPVDGATVDLGGGADTAKVDVFGDLVMDGGAGADRLLASGLHAHLTGDGGDDLLLASSNSNTVVDGGPGADTIWGGGTATTLTGDDGKDTIYSETSNPRVDGGDGADTIIILRANPTPTGVIAGGNGADLIVAELPDVRTIGNGTYDGGAGNDVIDVAHNGSVGDRVTCGDGTDTVYADAFDTVAADCETVVRTQAPAGSAAANAVAQGLAFRAARIGTTYTPGPLMPGW